MNFQAVCGDALWVAAEAGEYILQQRKTFDPSDIEVKGEHDFVSYVDKNAEKRIVEGLSRIVPGAGYITEEGTARDSGERYRWVIDPLDGTTNFIHDHPPYCVSIALMDGNSVKAGMIYELTRKEMFYAWDDSPAYVNGTEIKASAITSLENALIAVGFTYGAAGITGELERLAYYQRNTDGIRRGGSAAANLAYVACGRIDAFAQARLKSWDVAAGGFIAARAGAVVSDFDRGDDYIFGGRIVTAAPGIYDEFLMTIR